MPSRSGEQLSKPMDESQSSGISFAVGSEFANEASLGCFLSSRLKACSLSVHRPYGIALPFVQLWAGRVMSYAPRDVAMKVKLNNVAYGRGDFNFTSLRT